VSEQDGPEVRPEELAGAAGACAAVLDVAAPAAAEAVRSVAVVPGGRSGAAAVALAGRWEAAVALWVADVVAHGEALAAAAAGYADVDGAGAGAYGARP
jgi:hypothetical protein